MHHFFLNNISRAFLNYLRPKWHSIVVITVSTVCKYHFKQKCVWSQIWKWGILIFREFLRCVTNYYYANGYCCYIVLISVYSPLFCTYYLVHKPTLFFFQSRGINVKAVMSCNQSCSSFNCRTPLNLENNEELIVYQLKTIKTINWGRDILI